MKRLVMIILPCIIMLVLVWGYVPAAKELVGKLEKISSNFKINNINEASKTSSDNQIKKEDEVSVIVDNEKKTDSSQNKSDNKASVYRIVKQYKGKLGIFLPDTPLVPERIIDVEISTLPPEDKKMFEKGLLINSNTQLANLIEDYTS